MSTNILMLGALLVGAHILTRGTGGATAKDQLFGGGGAGGGGGLFGPGGLFGDDKSSGLAVQGGGTNTEGGDTSPGFDLNSIFSGINDAIERFAGELNPDVTSEITSDEDIGVAVFTEVKDKGKEVIVIPADIVLGEVLEAPAPLDFWTSPVVLEAEKTSGRDVVRLESTTIDGDTSFEFFTRADVDLTEKSNIFIVTPDNFQDSGGGYSSTPEAIIKAEAAGYFSPVIAKPQQTWQEIEKAFAVSDAGVAYKQTRRDEIDQAYADVLGYSSVNEYRNAQDN
jgi:hypothetical protein